MPALDGAAQRPIFGPMDRPFEQIMSGLEDALLLARLACVSIWLSTAFVFILLSGWALLTGAALPSLRDAALAGLAWTALALVLALGRRPREHDAAGR